MRRFLSLLCHEILVQNRVHNILRYNVQFILLSLICLIFLYPREQNIAEFGLIFLIISLPLAAISTTKPIIKTDIADGSMELLLITVGASEVICTKFLSLFLINIAALTISMPFIALFYHLFFDQVIFSAIACILLLVQVSAMSLFVGCIEGYFRSNTDFISSILFPIIIPGIIVSGLMLNAIGQAHLYISLLLGIDLVIVPIILALSVYLLKNVYNHSE